MKELPPDGEEEEEEEAEKNVESDELCGEDFAESSASKSKDTPPSGNQTDQFQESQQLKGRSVGTC